MSIQVCAEIKKDTMDMRDAYCSSLIRLADGDERIIALDADLMGAMGTKPFEKEYPGGLRHSGSKHGRRRLRDVRGGQDPVCAYVRAVYDAPRVRPDIHVRRIC